jgi:Zn-finger nucleic acid-binding protein
LSEDINQCPQCQGSWLTEKSLERIIALIEPAESLEEYRANAQPTEDKDNTRDKSRQSPQYKKRKHPHFLSGAFDIGDW